MRRKSGNTKESSRKSNSSRRAGSGGSSRGITGHILVVMLMKLLLVLLMFFLCRIIFFALNFSYFSDAGAGNLFRMFLAGFRFDIAAILIINTPFILMMTIPFSFRFNRVYQGVANTYFYFINILAFFVNLVDTIYFRFTLKRLTTDIFTYVGVGGDFDKLVPQFLKDFWHVALLWLLFIVAIIWLGRRFRVNVAGAGKHGNGFGSFLLSSLFFILVGGLTVIGVRGGLQLRPIGLVTAGQYASAKYIPLVINTPFSIAKSIGGEKLKTLSYFRSEEELSRIYTPVHHGSNSKFKPLNVVIVLLESFSKEHIGSLNRDYDRGRYQGFTPFLDSLIPHGYYFDAYANGKTTIQGIPAVLSGIPSLMNESFIQSPYGANKYSSIAGLLKEKGYTTAFFHGGTNGTMGFDSYTRMVGFDRYYGRSEYNNEKDYDGKWGIRDEEFMQYMARNLEEFPQPFLATLFTLSSHHPYTVPAKYVNIFRKGKLPIQQSVMYTDHSLRMFFKTVEKMPWYRNTLFVLTADHTSEGYYPFYQSNVGQYAIPLLFYYPGGELRGKSETVAQQTDIMPTVLKFLGYEKPFLAFGANLFDTTGHAFNFSVHYVSGIYGMMKDGYYLETDGDRVTALFNLREDLLQRNNLAGKGVTMEKEFYNFMKAFRQQYNNRLIENRLYVGQ